MVKKASMTSKKLVKKAVKKAKPKVKTSRTGVKTKNMSGKEKVSEVLFQLGKKRARPKPKKKK
jgi:hypothetical protein